MQVYAINNIANGKVYVGQHSGEDLLAYLKHNIRAALRKAGNKLFLYRAIRKYGAENFTIRCIHKCADKAEMDRAEKAYIKLFGTQDPELGYNITAGGGGQLGVRRPHTEEEKIKIGLAHKGKITSEETKAKLSKVQKGKTLSEEHRVALVGSHGGKQKQTRSPEHSLKISETKKKWWAERKRQEAECRLHPMASPAAA